MSAIAIVLTISAVLAGVFMGGKPTNWRCPKCSASGWGQFTYWSYYLCAGESNCKRVQCTSCHAYFPCDVDGHIIHNPTVEQVERVRRDVEADAAREADPKNQPAPRTWVAP